ncbi:rhamnan synthesis F family protein [Amnibacterium flavum]|uniref:Rhamnan synthesis protein F n=1 Tax=Amnibacterium flavum TaxID=2173173 RepID=A0A2V1HYJ2_9MICO|nr:rhamnan synthesis F family protein [Amnibacterium flavum]PVZ95867.1 hypothetical protein DDQ50_05225 [Amnibacterium flavum]
MKTAELVSSPAKPAYDFPAGGRRLLVYVVYDPRGDVEDYIPFALEALRGYCGHVLVVVNGELTDVGRAKLEPVSDRILVRENRGYDVTAYKDAIFYLGDELEEWDELILANDTWYGPIRDFEPLFERMNRRPLHFWGMTDHARVEPNPFTQVGYLAYHLQSYWVAVRAPMLRSEEWAAYWRDLPELVTYADAVVKHEAVFTEHFVDRGFIGEVAYPTLTDRIENHAVLYAEQLLEAGCPTLKRRPFFQWPVYLDHLAVVGRWTLDAVRRYGYPIELIYSDLARNVEPRILNADAAMLEVLPDTDLGRYDADAPFRILAAVHIFYPEMTGEILSRLEHLPGPFDLIVTTPEVDRAEMIREELTKRHPRGSVEVRVVASNNGRDQAAFLIGCRDELLGGRYDLVVKLHSKKTPQDAANVGRHFKEQLFDSLLRSPGYVANLVALFQEEPGLGIVFPPMVHIGHPTMGHSWWENKPAFVQLAARLGIKVPVDAGSPLAPYGSMFIARPAALTPLLEADFTFEEFGGPEAYQDGGLAHVLERLPVYAAGERGFHARTVASARYIGTSYTALEYTMDQISRTLPGRRTMDQIEYLNKAGPFDWGTTSDFVEVFARVAPAALGRRVRMVFGLAQKVRRRIGWLRGSLARRNQRH